MDRGGNLVYARISTFEGGTLERSAPLAGSPAVDQRSLPSSIRRVIVLAERQRDRRLFISLFDSLDELETADRRLDELGDEIEEALRGHRTSVEWYEVLTQVLPDDGRYTRVLRTEVAADLLDAATDVARDQLLPRLQEAEEWNGTLTLVDRERGTALFITFHRNPPMAESAPENENSGDLASQNPAASIDDEEFEVVLNREPEHS
jgi:hypothetical protein